MRSGCLNFFFYHDGKAYIMIHTVNGFLITGHN